MGNRIGYDSTIFYDQIVKVVMHTKTVLISIFMLLIIVGTAQSQTSDKQALYQKELDAALKNPDVSEYHKITYKSGKFLYTFQTDLLQVTADSLFTRVPELDLFYFMVFTRSMNGADNEYPKQAADAAYRFVTTRTAEFVEYFTNAPGLTDQDLDHWAKHLALEISRKYPKAKMESADDLGKMMRTALGGVSDGDVIDRLVGKVKGQLSEG